MSTLRVWIECLGVAIGGVILCSVNSAIAQISPDGTLPTIVKTEGNTINIEGGTQLESNLFHSFSEFSVPTGSTAEFKYSENVQNIISRVTGQSISKIEGILKADGTANLFLINPNGIIFGPNSSLQIGGSFVGSTASSLNFADGTKFSATNVQTTPLLTVSVPIGLQFGATAAPIRNQSQAASPYGNKNILRQNTGLEVKPGKTLALVGGDIILEGGNLTAPSGRIELGSVASNSLVSLNPTNQGWALGYEGVQNFQNIQLIQRTADGIEFPSTVDASGNERGSNIQVYGKNVLLTGGSRIWAFALGSLSGGNLTVTGAESVELIDPNTSLRTGTLGSGNAGDLTINTRWLIVKDGSQAGSSTTNTGDAGNLTVNASESVELIAGSDDYRTGLLSITSGAGLAGNVTIKTQKLRIQNGAGISTESTRSRVNSQQIPATGKGGNLTVNASESVELIGASSPENPSGLFASALRYGNAGTINVITGQLIIRDGAVINVNVDIPSNAISSNDTSNTATPGTLNVTARSIFLDNGQITSNSESGQGGNITLQVRDLLSMRRNSQITTNARANGNGGNITIDAPNGLVFAAPLENSDITANAFFGSGGKITINADSIFGFVQRDRTDFPTQEPEELDPKNLPTNDITAFSQQNPSLNGTVEINSPDVDPSKGLVELPVNAVDAQDKIVAGCNSVQRIARASFIATGRGGIASSPTDALISDAVLTDWIVLEGQDENRAAGVQKKPVTSNHRHTQNLNYVNSPAQIVEAQGWVMDSNGNVVLVAQAPTVTPYSSGLNPASCPVN